MENRKYADRREYLIKAVAERRRKIKKFGIAEKGYTRAWTKVKEELDKCVLLCANCHREVEAGISFVPAGSKATN